VDWKSALQVLQAALQIEMDMHQVLINLHKIAQENNDPALEQLLEQDFLEHQVDVVRELAGMLTELERTGALNLGLWIFDQHLI
jgi:ferritin heavy chain